jgi:diguanylate cyclase (GGDEF)-like protein
MAAVKAGWTTGRCKGVRRAVTGRGRWPPVAVAAVADPRRALLELALAAGVLGSLALWVHGRVCQVSVGSQALLLTAALLAASWLVESVRVPVGLDRVGRVRAMSGVNAVLLPAAVLLEPELSFVVALGSVLPLVRRSGWVGSVAEGLMRVTRMSAAALAFYVISPAGAEVAELGEWMSARTVLGLVLSGLTMLVVESLCVTRALRVGEGLLPEDAPWLSARELVADSPVVAIGALVCVLTAAPAALVLLVPLFLLEHQMLRAHAARLRGYRDAKTGLLTLTAFDDLAARELARARRTGESVALLMMDLDGLKAINTGQGHLAGDRVIEALARLLLDTCRREDLVCRFGGDEFCILLPGAGMAQAELIAERVRFTAMSTPVTGPSDGLALSVSVGVAVAMPTDGVVSLLNRADAGLRDAKLAGGNRVRVMEAMGG